MSARPRLLALLLHASSFSLGFDIANFRAVSVDDVNIAQALLLPGRTTHLLCSHSCLTSAPPCSGFLFSDGRCRLFPQAQRKLQEVFSPAVALWLRIDLQDPECNPFWFRVGRGRSRYSFYPGAKPWEEAASYCSSFGAQLLQVTGEGERAFVGQHVVSHEDHVTDGASWVGLRKAEDGSWRWEPSEANLTASQLWKEGEPRSYSGVNYGAYSTREGRLIAGSSSDNLTYICECHML